MKQTESCQLPPQAFTCQQQVSLRRSGGSRSGNRRLPTSRRAAASRFHLEPRPASCQRSRFGRSLRDPGLAAGRLPAAAMISPQFSPRVSYRLSGHGCRFGAAWPVRRGPATSFAAGLAAAAGLTLTPIGFSVFLVGVSDLAVQLLHLCCGSARRTRALIQGASKLPRARSLARARSRTSIRALLFAGRARKPSPRRPRVHRT